MFTNVIWLNEQAMVATFHQERGFIPYPQLDRSQFLKFLDSLLEKGYKFI